MENIQEQTARLLGDIQMLAYEVNEKTDHAVFVTFSGHVKALDVRIGVSKEIYTEYVFKAYSFFPHNDDWLKVEEMMEGLESIKAELTKLLLPVNIFEMESDGEVMTDRH